MTLVATVLNSSDLKVASWISFDHVIAQVIHVVATSFYCLIRSFPQGLQWGFQINCEHVSFNVKLLTYYFGYQLGSITKFSICVTLVKS